MSSLTDRVPTCPRCSHPLRRSHRTPLQKVLYARVYQCIDCHYTSRAMRPTLSAIVHRLLATIRAIPSNQHMQ